MSTYFLIRHGHNDYVGKTIAGRMQSVPLNAQGEKEAAAVAENLSRSGITRIVASPLERARETALPLARALGLDIEISNALNEIDFGHWTNQTLSYLESLPRWKQFTAFRSGLRIPGGELMIEAQARVVGLMQKLREEAPSEAIALVTHGDVIRAALTFYLGMPIDLGHRIEISPSSISALVVDDVAPQLLYLNRRP